MNYIIWNEKDSRYINGLVISELPPISKPPMRIAETVVDGVDGSYIEELGYSPYDKPLVIGIKANANIDEIVKFFSGKGEVIFSNEPDKFYKAHIINQIDYTRLVRFRTATVVFKVQPYKYKPNEMPVTAPMETTEDELVFYVDNAGTETSRPLFHIKGQGKIECRVNQSGTFRYNFPDNETEVYIDCEIQDAYLGSILKNRNMEGEYPYFDAGMNKVWFSGNITSVEVYARSRWL